MVLLGQDLDDNRTGVVRHFKQANLYNQADIDNAIAEAHESNSLNLVQLTSCCRNIHSFTLSLFPSASPSVSPFSRNLSATSS